MGSAAQRLYSTGTIFLHFIYFYIFLYFLYFYIFYIFIFFIFLHFLHFGNDMADVCGIIADIKREEQGVYVFPQLTLMGYDTNSPELAKLKDLGIKIGDENARYEGVEVARSSPYKLMRTMAKAFGFSAKEASTMEAPGGRTFLTWTLMTDFAEECIGVVADIKREGEGEYTIPTCTIFGLDRRRKDSWSHMDSRYLTATPGWMELRSPDLLPSR